MTDPDPQLAPTGRSQLAIRWVSVGFALLFALSAAVQLNDPDWGPWFAFYVAATAVAAVAPRWRHGQRTASVALIVALLWCVGIAMLGVESITIAELFHDLRMKTLNVERWREMGGLTITAAWMAVLTATLPRVGQPGR